MTEFRRSSTLPHLEARRSCRENVCYRPHAHDSFSIGAIDAGTSVVTGPLEGGVRLAPGDVIVIPADQVHACNPDRGLWRYQMIHMDQAWAESLAPGRGSSRLFEAIRVLRNPELYIQVNAVNDAICADEPRERLEARFTELFASLEAAAPAHAISGEAAPELLPRLAPVMHRLRTDESNPRLSELAAAVGMTTYQLVRAMRRATGLPPLAWRQNARVLRAREMLRQGQPIAESAYALGFTDQSHFHRVFSAHVATSPGSYRASCKNVQDRSA